MGGAIYKKKARNEYLSGKPVTKKKTPLTGKMSVFCFC